MKFVLVTLALTCVWVLLMENISLFTVLSGLFFSVLTMIFCHKALPMDKIKDIRFSKLILYPFVLIGEVYAAGFHVIKLIFTGAEAEMIRVRTDITNETLKIILVDSVTLTPGTIHVRLEGDEFTLLWLRDRHEAALPVKVRDQAIKGRLEKWLLKAQIPPGEGKELS